MEDSIYLDLVFCGNGQLPENGLVGMATIGCDLRSSLFALHLAEKYPQVTCAVGVHPSDCGELNDKSFADLAELQTDPSQRQGLFERGIYNNSPNKDNYGRFYLS